MENREKIVEFSVYCPTCKHYEKEGVEEPCDECLENPMNIDSHKPVKWEEK